MKKNKQRRWSNELLDESAVDEDGDDNAQEYEGEDEERQQYLLYDIEARQEDGRHIANLLIVQDEKGFETVFKIVLKNSVNGCWTERTKERSSQLITLAPMILISFASIFTKSVFFLNWF